MRKLFKAFSLPELRKEATPSEFTELKPDAIIRTLAKLEIRIGTDFPASGLRKVAIEFCDLAARAAELAGRLQQPILVVRAAVLGAAILLTGLGAWAIVQLVNNFSLTGSAVPEIVQATESVINELIFLVLALFFLTNLETRLKRQAALKALHQLRSIAHVVDMHQLTKDPANLLSKLNELDPAPERVQLTRLQLTRYLDYC